MALSVLRARVRRHADLGPDTTSTTARWPNADINREINASWQALRRLLVSTSAAKTLYCKASSANTAQGATSPKAWTDLPLPADFSHLVGLEITLPNGRLRSLTPIAFEERNQYFDTFGLITGTPLHFFIYNVGVESANTVSTGTAGLVPATNAIYAYTLWYLPSWVDRITDTDVFDGVEGWDDWVIWDVVEKIAMAEGGADGGMGAVAELAAREREKAEQAILQSANGVQRVGPITRIDMMGAARRERRERIWRGGGL